MFLIVLSDHGVKILHSPYLHNLVFEVVAIVVVSETVVEAVVVDEREIVLMLAH